MWEKKLCVKLQTIALVRGGPKISQRKRSPDYLWSLVHFVYGTISVAQSFLGQHAFCSKTKLLSWGIIDSSRFGLSIKSWKVDLPPPPQM